MTSAIFIPSKVSKVMALLVLVMFSECDSVVHLTVSHGN